MNSTMLQGSWGTCESIFLVSETLQTPHSCYHEVRICIAVESRLDMNMWTLWTHRTFDGVSSFFHMVKDWTCPLPFCVLFSFNPFILPTSPPCWPNAFVERMCYSCVTVGCHPSLHLWGETASQHSCKIREQKLRHRHMRARTHVCTYVA